MSDAMTKEAERLASRTYKTEILIDYLSDGTPAYLAYHPELPGCQAQGHDPIEAFESLRDARFEYIYFLLEDGLAVPEPQRHDLTLPHQNEVVFIDTTNTTEYYANLSVFVSQPDTD